MTTVYVYRGTFDPFHNNHAAICEWCLEQSNISSLVIHINYKETSAANTKNPASWEVRFNIVNTALNDASRSNVVVSPQKKFDQTIEWIINQYGRDTHVVQVLGDDILAQAKDSPQIHSYAVHQRNSAGLTDSIPFLFNKERINIPLKLPNISSTHIRSLLISLEMNEISSMVPNSVFLLLKSIKDYSPLQLSLQQLKKHKISVTDLFVQKLVTELGEYIYLKYEPVTFNGLSGDILVSVFSVEQQRIAICKLFAQETDGCINELTGYELLSKHVKTPKIHFICDDGFCMELILGKNAQTTHDFFRIGQAYRQLHTHSMSDIEEDTLKQNIYFEGKINKLLSKFTDKDLSMQVQLIFINLLQKHYQTPRRLSITHGDAQPGNTLLTTDEVVFIDPSKVTQASDPSRDIHQMIASIYWRAYNHQDTKNVENIQNNINAFLEGYGWDLNSSSLDLWAFYWHMRTLLLAIEAPETPLSKHIINIDHPQSTAPSIRNHPFWSSHLSLKSQQEITIDSVFNCQSHG